MTNHDRLIERCAQPVHSYGCDCEECWIGFSVNAPKPPSVFRRICNRLFRATKEQQDG